MFGLGIAELLIILVIVIVMFGGTRLPLIGEGLGKSIRNFRKQMSAPDEIDITPSKDETKAKDEVK